MGSEVERKWEPPTAGVVEKASAQRRENALALPDFARRTGEETVHAAASRGLDLIREVEEARATIARLRDELAELRAERHRLIRLGDERYRIIAGDAVGEV